MHKTGKHGDLAGLPVNSKGQFDKTEQNALASRDDVVKQANDPSCSWKYCYYQAGTPREAKMIGVRDPKNDQIGVYTLRNDGTYQYLTNCQMNDIESKHYDKTGNFTIQTVLMQQNSGTGTSNTNTNTNN